MSYHILHQFDEQWFGESGQEDGSSQSKSLFRSRNKTSGERQRPWLIVGLSLIIAAFALYFAMDARRQTIDLQQRLADVESRLKK